MTDEEKSKELISKIHHSSKVEKKHFKAWNGRPKPHHTTSIDPDRLWQNRNVAYSNIPRWDAYNIGRKGKMSYEIKGPLLFTTILKQEVAVQATGNNF